MLKNYIKNKSAGFYLFLVSYVLFIIGFVFFLIDGGKEHKLTIVTVILSVISIALPLIVEILKMFKIKIDPIDLTPIIFVTLAMAGTVMFIGDRVDILGYIFTNHYSFTEDYPELLVTLIFLILSIIGGLVTNFFKLEDSK